MRKRVLLTLAAALAVAPFIVSGVARAANPTQTPTPKSTPATPFSNNYYSNVNVEGLPDGTVRVVNDSGSSQCALMYVTDKDQEMKECCGCPVSNKGTLIFDVDGNLTNNPANGLATTDGSIAIISSASTNCDPAVPKATPELEAWATHPQKGGLLTEAEFTPLSLSSAAKADLSAECAAIELVGSGAGICTCPTKTPPVGSCLTGSSLSVEVSGTNVVSYVPKGNWGSSITGVSLVNVEGSSITPGIIPTANAVNSCASNSVTGQTVCTANNTDVYVIPAGSSPTVTKLTSSGSSTIVFSGGICTNCNVAMDAVHNKAVIGLSVAGAPGFQFLDLSGISPSFESAVTSPAGEISEEPLLDPFRNLLLSATEGNDFELASVATAPPSLTPLTSFFENSGIASGGELDSASEDCSTGIALAPAEFTSPSNVFIADLTQAKFTPGSPGTWTDAPGSQVQTLTESLLFDGFPAAAPVAQGTHTGVVAGEFGGNAITAFLLPSSSGSGTPAILDWVTCNIPNDPSGAAWNEGNDPHTVTAYQDPASPGDAIGLFANGAGSPPTYLAKVDLTQMLKSTIVPRTSGAGLGHACSAGTLPSSVVSFVAVP